MRVAIIGSRSVQSINIGEYLPDGVTEIVSGGAKGADTIAREYAKANNIKLTEFLPDYKKYGRGAPLRRNEEIVNYADRVIAFWDGESHGTKHVIDFCAKAGKPCRVVYITR